jgi:hypothetical protein
MNRMQDKHNIQICNKSFEMEEEFRNLGTTLANQNSIHEEFKSNPTKEILALIRCRISSSTLTSKNIKRYTEL